jgi:hypothetical protein
MSDTEILYIIKELSVAGLLRKYPMLVDLISRISETEPSEKEIDPAIFCENLKHGFLSSSTRGRVAAIISKSMPKTSAHDDYLYAKATSDDIFKATKGADAAELCVHNGALPFPSGESIMKKLSTMFNINRSCTLSVIYCHLFKSEDARRQSGIYVFHRIYKHGGEFYVVSSYADITLPCDRVTADIATQPPAALTDSEIAHAQPRDDYDNSDLSEHTPENQRMKRPPNPFCSMRGRKRISLNSADPPEEPDEPDEPGSPKLMHTRDMSDPQTTPDCPPPLHFAPINSPQIKYLDQLGSVGPLEKTRN